MSSKTEYEKDAVFERSRVRHLVTASFLSALKTSLNHEKAFEVAAKGFANYMIVLGIIETVALFVMFFCMQALPKI